MEVMKKMSNRVATEVDLRAKQCGVWCVGQEWQVASADGNTSDRNNRNNKDC